MCAFFASTASYTYMLLACYDMYSDGVSPYCIYFITLRNIRMVYLWIRNLSPTGVTRLFCIFDVATAIFLSDRG